MIIFRNGGNGFPFFQKNFFPIPLGFTDYFCFFFKPVPVVETTFNRAKYFWQWGIVGMFGVLNVQNARLCSKGNIWLMVEGLCV